MAAAMIALKEVREREAAAEAKRDAKMRQAFYSLDKDGSGALDVDEMLEALGKMNMYNPEDKKEAAKRKRLVKREAGKDGELDFEEFKELVAKVALQEYHDKTHPWDIPVDWLPYNEDARLFYNRQSVQGFIAVIIAVNFLAIIVEKEIDPYDVRYQRFTTTWDIIDYVSNIVFILELLLNLYGSYWKPFVTNPWNALDITVVAAGILTMTRVPLGPARQFIKVLRVFRILRIFKKVPALRQILVALLRSIPGVMNAFIVMFIFMAIYALIFVDLFRSFGSTGEYSTIQTYGPNDATWGEFGSAYTGEYAGDVKAREENVSHDISAKSLRGFHYGQEYFGTFSRSLYTMFQVLTGESWSEAVVRPVLFGWNSGEPFAAFIIGLSFISFFVLTAIVLQNVVVTVLLDAFLATPAGAEEKKESAAELARQLGAMGDDDEDGAGGPASAPAAASYRKAAAPGPASAKDMLAGAQSTRRPSNPNELSDADARAMGKKASAMLTQLSQTRRALDQLLKDLPQTEATWSPEKTR